MKRISGFALAALAASLFSSPVDAQVLSPSSSSQSGSASNSQAGSQSGSAAGAAVILDQSSRNSGNVNNPAQPTDVTVRSAPTVYVPNVVTGNVCALGASAGASFIGTGFAVGASWESMNCETRQRVALLFNMGHKGAAKELLCGSDRVIYDAYKTGGEPCAVRPEWEPKPVAGQQPATPVAAPAPAPQPVRTAFNASQYPNASDCLNAAAAAGAPFTECRGKR